MGNTSKSPTVDTYRQRVLGWFTGKSYQNAEHALQLLAASEELGSWVPGASRKVSAAFGKASNAIKLGRAYEKELEAIGDYKTPSDQRGFEVSMLLRYSQAHLRGRRRSTSPPSAPRRASPGTSC